MENGSRCRGSVQVPIVPTIGVGVHFGHRAFAYVGTGSSARDVHRGGSPPIVDRRAEGQIAAESRAGSEYVNALRPVALAKDTATL